MNRDLNVTALLQAVGANQEGAAEQLFPLVYEELRRLAAQRLRGERSDHTLQATALVHEAYLKLVDQSSVEWRSRAHFLAIAAQAIRRILVDHARTKKRLKRGGGAERQLIDEAMVQVEARANGDLLTLDDALARLAADHPDKARIVELRFFGGLSNEEIAGLLDITTRTVERHWQFARAWLFRALQPDADSEKK